MKARWCHFFLVTGAEQQQHWALGQPSSFLLVNSSHLNLKCWLHSTHAGSCSTKGQWAALIPPTATCRKHPSRPATCWAETKWTVLYTGLRRSASGGPTAAQTYKVPAQSLTQTRTFTRPWILTYFYKMSGNIVALSIISVTHKNNIIPDLDNCACVLLSACISFCIFTWDFPCALSHWKVLKTKVITVWVVSYLLLTGLEYLGDHQNWH